MTPANPPMSKSYYESGPKRADKVKALFERIASRYDLINDLQSFGLHRRWKRHVIDLARGTTGQSALDVCCGTGDLALGLAKNGFRVTGLDFSESMLEIARTKASRLAGQGAAQSQSPGVTAERTKTGQPLDEGATLFSTPSAPVPALRLIHGDAQQLPFPDSEFDVVTIGYGLRNLADWEKGLGEMHRVMRSRGKLLVLDFGKPENRLLRAIYYSYLQVFVPLLGLIFCGSARAYAYILDSLRHYPAQHGVAAKMRDLGFSNIRIIRFLGGIMTINYGEKR